VLRLQQYNTKSHKVTAIG